MTVVLFAQASDIAATIACTLPTVTTVMAEASYFVDMENDLPSLTTEMFSGAIVSTELPLLTSSISALVGAVGSIENKLQAVVSEMFSGAMMRSTFPSVTATATVTTVHFGTINTELPKLTAQMTGHAGIIAQIENTLPVIINSINAYHNISVAMASVLPKLTSEMSVVLNTVCTVAVVLPALESEMTGITGLSVALVNVLPALSSYATAGPLLTYQTFCMNLEKKELVSKFTNFSFNSYGYISKRSIAANSSGLFLLDGSSDNGSPIIANIKTPALNFGSYLIKKLRAFRLGGRFHGSMTITVNNGYMTWPVTLAMLNSMVHDYSKGYFTHYTRGEYLTFEITNADGSDFTLDEISLYLSLLERR